MQPNPSSLLMVPASLVPAPGLALDGAVQRAFSEDGLAGPSLPTSYVF